MPLAAAKRSKRFVTIDKNDDRSYTTWTIAGTTWVGETTDNINEAITWAKNILLADEA